MKRLRVIALSLFSGLLMTLLFVSSVTAVDNAIPPAVVEDSTWGVSLDAMDWLKHQKFYGWTYRRDGSGLIAETDETDNTATFAVVVATQQIRLPIVLCKVTHTFSRPVYKHIKIAAQASLYVSERDAGCGNRHRVNLRNICQCVA